MASPAPQTTEPIGAPSPLEKQNCTVSTPAASSSAPVPRATAALKIRAPSRWIESPWRRAAWLAAAITSIGTTRPPEWLWLFSHTISEILGRKRPAEAIATSTCSGWIRPPWACTVRKATPDSAEAAPRSTLRTWAPSSQRTSSPGRVWSMTESWLPMVPLGTNTPASFPTAAAASSSRRFTVGSSP